MLFIELPAAVKLEITFTEPGLAGDSATCRTMPATLETGRQIQVPLFVKKGEKVRVDIRDSPSRSSTPARSWSRHWSRCTSPTKQRPEVFRHTSVVMPHASAVIADYGIECYRMALEHLARS